jgi:hypothetical protein
MAEADLWRDARTLIRQARAEAPDDPTIAWNASLINLIAGGRERAIGPYPLLGNVFFGAYDRAVDTMRSYPPAAIFGENPSFVTGTVAEGSLESLVGYALAFSEKALAVNPELAPAHFVRGWALYHADPADPAALASIRRAQALDVSDSLYNQSAAYLAP